MILFLLLLLLLLYDFVMVVEKVRYLSYIIYRQKLCTHNIYIHVITRDVNPRAISLPRVTHRYSNHCGFSVSRKCCWRYSWSNNEFFWPWSLKSNNHGIGSLEGRLDDWEGRNDGRVGWVTGFQGSTFFEGNYGLDKQTVINVDGSRCVFNIHLKHSPSNSFHTLFIIKCLRGFLSVNNT